MSKTTKQKCDLWADKYKVPLKFATESGTVVITHIAGVELFLTWDMDDDWFVCQHCLKQIRDQYQEELMYRRQHEEHYLEVDEEVFIEHVEAFKRKNKKRFLSSSDYLFIAKQVLL